MRVRFFSGSSITRMEREKVKSGSGQRKRGVERKREKEREREKAKESNSSSVEAIPSSTPKPDASFPARLLSGRSNQAGTSSWASMSTTASVVSSGDERTRSTQRAFPLSLALCPLLCCRRRKKIEPFAFSERKRNCKKCVALSHSPHPRPLNNKKNLLDLHDILAASHGRHGPASDASLCKK